MKLAIVTMAALALCAGSAVAQQGSSVPDQTTVPQAQQQQSYPETQESNPQYPQTQQQYPQSTYPQSTYPESTYPQNQQQYPQSTYPQNQQQYPQSTYPQNQQQYPQSTYPQSTYPTTAQSGSQIPAGTQLSIRTDQDINATSDDQGRTFDAEIAEDVMGANGQVLIPKSSPAKLVVQDVKAGTMGAGSMEAALALQSVMINGRVYNVASDTQTASGNRGIGANKRTAEMTGGGALLGTVLGAVLGGGKGAAIGAIAGAGAGATAQVVTRGKQVKVPAETVLQFKLDQPVTLQ